MEQIEGSSVSLQSTEVIVTVIFCKLELHFQQTCRILQNEVILGCCLSDLLICVD